MTDPLLLRRTVIAGDTVPDDYVVIWDGITIGRIHRPGGLPPGWGAGVRGE